jgi:hypothetical protein
MRLGEFASEPPSDCMDGNVGCKRGDSGEAWLYGLGTEVTESDAAWPLEYCGVAVLE